MQRSGGASGGAGSSGGGRGSGGSQRGAAAAASADWSEAARRASQRARVGPGGLKIKCPGNLLLYFFFVELKNAMTAADPQRHHNAIQGCGLAKEAVLTEPCRVVTRPHLAELKGVKEMLSNIVERHLWSLYPPDEEDEEEQQLREQRDAAKEAERKAAAAAKRAATKQQKQQEAAATAAAAAAAAAAAGGFGSGGSATGGGFSGGGVDAAAFSQPGVAPHDPLSELERILRRDPKAAGLYAEVQRQAAAGATGSSGGGGSAAAAAASGGGTARPGSAGRKRVAAAGGDVAGAEDGQDGSQQQQQQQAPKKRRAAAPKEYTPTVGSANYAFVITLYLRHRTGQHHLSKEELIMAAEGSKLADTPIRGNTNGWAAQRGAGKYYDGWSCVKTLENRDVPLIHRWSNPIKIRLTAAGMALGAKLYKHATGSGRLAPHPDVDPDEAPPVPDSPTAAAAADQAAAAAAAAAAKEAAAAAKKKPRLRKGAAAVAAAAAAAGGGEESDEEYVFVAAPQQQQQQQQQQTPQQQQQQAGGDLEGLDADVAAVIAATQAAAAAAARLGVGVGVQDPGGTTAAAAADFGGWGDDDPCMAGDGFWNDPGPAAAAVAAAAAAAVRQRRRPKAAAAAAAAVGDGLDDCPVYISDDEEGEGDGGRGQQQQQQRWGPDSTAAGAGGGGSRGVAADGSPAQQQRQQQEEAGEDDDDDVAAVIDVIFEGDVTILADMGFERQQAVKALKHVDGSLFQAITLLTESPEVLDQLPEQQQQQQQRKKQRQQQQSQQQSQPERFSQPTQQSAAGTHQQQQQSQAGSHQQASQQQQSQQQQQQSSQQGSQPAAAGHRKPPRPENLHRAATTAAAAAAASAGSGGIGRQGSGVSGGAPSRQGSGLSSGAGSSGGGGSGGLGRQDSGLSGGSSRGTAAAAAAADDDGYVGLRLPALAGPLLDTQLSLPLPPLPAGARFDSQYDVVLLIDQREQYSRAGPGARTLGRTESLRKHAAAIAAQGVTVDSSVTLPCGDVAWVAQHKATKQRYLLDFLAERKSYADLSSSIIDGRYTAQKWMMAGQDAARNCFYILEGNPADLNLYGQATSSKQQACVTSLHRMLLHDGFKVMETGGPAETVDLLASITRILVDVYGSRTNSSSSSSGDGGGLQLAQSLDSWKAGITTTRRTKTVRQKWQELLLSVQGIGEEAVSAVVAAYPTPISLYRAYATTITGALASGRNATAAARALLAELPQSSGQRLGPARAAVVYDKLFANGWNLAA